MVVQVYCETNDDGSFLVEVADDGVGFPENFDPLTDGGLGFQLMRALANGLNAELQFERDVTRPRNVGLAALRLDGDDQQAA